MSDRVVRIGGAGGAWGDSPIGIRQLLDARVDYLMMDFLAEVTMSLLARARLKNPDAGYPPDFVSYVGAVLPQLSAQGVKVVSNGGGVNPTAAKAAIDDLCARTGLDLTVAVVTGDDVLPLVPRLRDRGVREMGTGTELPPDLLTANAYLGARPIAAALAAGADIVITGRCVDSALATGILMYEFGWKHDDYDALASGSLTGHLLECGPQVTGGNHTDWEKVSGWDWIGYPIAECRSDGTFLLTKPPQTGGLVNLASVSEQLLYEIGDPAAYQLPDGVADFSKVTLEQRGKDAVLVRGATGRAPSGQYKVSATYQDGFRAVAGVVIIGPDAYRKAHRTAEALLARARRLFRETSFEDFTATHVEVIGAESAYGERSENRASREVLLRLVVDHTSQEALGLFARELGSVGLSMAPGTAGLIGGRPKVTPVIRLCTFLVDKSELASPEVSVGVRPSFPVDVLPVDTPSIEPGSVPVPAEDSHALHTLAVPGGKTVAVPLRRLAYARSGDKGNQSNIAIIARRPEYVDILRREVTSERMAEHFAEQVSGDVVRYDVPGLHALNFVLSEALGGGGMASRRIDPQGKAFGQMALEMVICVPELMLES